ncbi:hypothetical protein C1H46_007335 [Malus baccata]|uniref:Uncharacterized protein n=1 Tax=Malus baccata TaxID=106549 RepID=A0A540N7Q0_MALBA|nr:hypothetical protein C1H46_007335 [Malus baccata]
MLHHQGPRRVSLQPGGLSQSDTCRHQKPIIARHMPTSEANHNMICVNVRTRLETLFYKRRSFSHNIS